MPKPISRRQLLQALGSAAIVGTAGCVDSEPTPWYGLGAAVVESPPLTAQTISASRPELDELEHVQQAVDEAVNEGEIQIETSRDFYRKTDEVFRDLPHLLVNAVRAADDSPEFETPEDSNIPDFLRAQALVPVIFVDTEGSPAAVWPVHYKLE